MLMNEVSILMPVYNCICVQLVDELARQCRDIDGLRYEIIAADDGSADTGCIEQNRTINDIACCRYIERGFNAGRAAIRNFLVSEARYEWLIILDSDVIIDKGDFIASYLNAGCEGIVYGGVHNAESAYDARSLRCIYECRFEHNNPASVRSTKPYQQFRTTNFMARRSIMAAHPFDEGFKEYGYEDVLFGKEMKDAAVAIKHTDNAVTVAEYDTNEQFLDKTMQALRSLHSHRSEMQGYSAVLAAADKLNRLHLCPFMSWMYRRCGGILQRRLSGPRPSLFLFNVFRLLYYISLGTK